MNLSRRSLSRPFWRAVGGETAGGAASLPSALLTRLASGRNGRSTAEEELNLRLIFSPLPRRRNDFDAQQSSRAALAGRTTAGDPPDRPVRSTRSSTGS